MFSHAGPVCLCTSGCCCCWLLVSIVCFHLIWITWYHWGNRVLRVYKRERRRCRPSISLISSPWKSTETRLVYWNNKPRWEKQGEKRKRWAALSLSFYTTTQINYTYQQHSTHDRFFFFFFCFNAPRGDIYTLEMGKVEEGQRRWNNIFIKRMRSLLAKGSQKVHCKAIWSRCV